MAKVYVFKCRISGGDRATIETEIERGHKYYNSMISQVNLDIAGRQSRGDQPAVEGAAARIERIARVICPDGERAVTVAAKAIYRRIKCLGRGMVSATTPRQRHGIYYK